VSLCRALGADVVIAVDLTRLPFTRQHKERKNSIDTKTILEQWPQADRLFGFLQTVTGKLQLGKDDERVGLPSALDVMVKSLNIMTSRISQSRLAGEPADLLIAPKVGDIAMVEFHRANETIELGYNETMRHRPELEAIRRYIEPE
jgi:NTE family protein